MSKERIWGLGYIVFIAVWAYTLGQSWFDGWWPVISWGIFFVVSITFFIFIPSGSTEDTDGSTTDQS